MSKQYPIPSRPDIEQIDSDKILLKWSITGQQEMPIDDEMIDYYKIEYKSGVNNKKHDWTIIDEKIDASKREYILTDLSPIESYRFRLSCFYKNSAHQVHSPQSFRFKLVELSPTKTSNNSSNTVTSGDVIEIQILQVWALSDSSLTIKWQLLNDLDSSIVNNNTYKQVIDGFYIYYRKLTVQEILNFDLQIPQADMPLENYQLVKIPNSQLHLVDTYIITNLDSISTYEIKMTCVGQNGKMICDTSNTVYGQTLNKSNAVNDLGMFAVPQQKYQNLDLVRTTPHHHHQSISTTLNQVQKQNEMLFTILGIILGVLTFVLVIFIIMCLIRHKQHKRLLIKLNTSQKLNSGSSCPTLIYDDCLRNLNQNNKLVVAAAASALSANTNTFVLNDANNNNNNNFLNLLASTQANSSTFNNTQTTLLSSGGVSSSVHQQPAPPIPSVPPPQISSTMNRNVNVNINPIGYLDANTINFLKQQQVQLQQQQQENFYHTLNFNSNNNTNGATLLHHFNNDYTNATLNLRAQLMLKQNPMIIEAINNNGNNNLVQRGSCLESPTMSHENENSCSMTPKKRNKRGSSSRSKKYEKVYQTQVLTEQEKLQLQYIQQLQQQQQIEQEQHNMLILTSILNNVQQQQQQQHQQQDESQGNNIYRSNKLLQYTTMSPTKFSNSTMTNNNDLLLQTANNQQVSSSSNSSSGIGSTTTANSGDSINEELVPFLYSSNNNQNINNNEENQSLNNNEYDYHKRLRLT